MEKSCEACVFSSGPSGYEKYECRRHAPSQLRAGFNPREGFENVALWPMVRGEWACGDWVETDEAH